LVNGLTQPKDVCFHCHEDIAEERPSHEGMAFVDCTTSGCHNYHDNRALYTDFLIKHMDQAAHLDIQTVEIRDFISVIDQIVEYPIDSYPIEKLELADIDAPSDVEVDEQLASDWHETSHAIAGVNCSGCHQPVDTDGVVSAWQDKPGLDGCVACHGTEVDDFQQGKHGMRLAAGLSPMTPSKAKLPMNPDNAHEELTCASCHGAHRFDVQQAAVESCLGCHNDEHSIAYKASSHFALWQEEVNGTAEPNSGVSCATCHMPRVEKDVSDWLSRVVVEHNQSEFFAPNSKMIRPVCQSCHGLPMKKSVMKNNATKKSALTNKKLLACIGLAAATGVYALKAYSNDAGSTPSITPKTMADALHLVMDSDRAVYTRRIVNRLAAKEKVITASEHFEDEKALVLPAAEANPNVNFSYSLQSIWPINKQNAPQTDAEIAGLQFVADNKGENYYTTEELGGTNYFTAVYADTAVSPVCASCHNDHKDSPRTDFKIGDVMGGVVIRIPIEG